jgi:hypothetical protein
MTCAQLGGPCGTAMTAATKDGLMNEAMAHVRAVHPEMVAQIEGMSKEDSEKWMKEYTGKWDATPDNA